MNKGTLIGWAAEFLERSTDNYISGELALCDSIVGTRLFDSPIFAIASAQDELFQKLKNPLAIGEHFKLPEEWLPQAKSVISIFLPFTDQVKNSNSIDRFWPSAEWLHGRVEGQALILKLCKYLESKLAEEGYFSITPAADDRFQSFYSADDANGICFSSNWSERHVGFISGLGTFGLSKGLITKKGTAGRLASLISDLELPSDHREYLDLYENCSMCGQCIEACPSQAISFENGKNHAQCYSYLTIIAEKNKPWHGCGKCQVKLPCESCIPTRP